MKRLTLKQIITTILLGIISLLIAAEEVKQAVEMEDEITVRQKQSEATVPSSLGSSRIRGWHAPDSKTVIIETSRGDFIGTFMNRCSGIMFAEDLGFSNMGPNELDKFTTIVLPDGERCFLSDLKPYKKNQAAN